MSEIPIQIYGTAAVAALLFGFWAVMLMDCLKRNELEFHTEMPNPKRMWTILLIVGIPWCAIIYFFVVKRKD
jgi:H+/Cl- antiporter ClcA